jgi:hypothetical protein
MAKLHRCQFNKSIFARIVQNAADHFNQISQLRLRVKYFKPVSTGILGANSKRQTKHY